MDFRQLESFITITKYKSFSKAARELYLTQPTLSTHIQALERELNIDLFKRKGRNIELTKAGEVFFSYAEGIIKTRNHAIFSLNEYLGKFEGTINITSSTIPEEYIIPKIIAEFNKLYPQIKFKISHLDSQDVLDAIEDKKYDFGFVGLKNSTSLIYKELFNDEIVVIGPKSSPLNNMPLTLEEISNLPLIQREEGSGSGKFFTQILREKKLSSNLNVKVIAENTETIKELVSLGVGYSVISKKALGHINPNANLISYSIADINPNRKFYLAMAKDRELSSLDKKFVDFALDFCENSKI
ncbi:MAG: selenium metabolism-associated LysR family transcriptional regulator [Filifactoraceae bacterium]